MLFSVKISTNVLTTDLIFSSISGFKVSSSFHMSGFKVVCISTSSFKSSVVGLNKALTFASFLKLDISALLASDKCVKSSATARYPLFRAATISSLIRLTHFIAVTLSWSLIARIQRSFKK